MTRGELLSRLEQMEQVLRLRAAKYGLVAAERIDRSAAQDWASDAASEALDALALSEARAALSEDRAVLILKELRAELHGQRFYTNGVDNWIVSKLAALKAPAPPTEEN